MCGCQIKKYQVSVLLHPQNTTRWPPPTPTDIFATHIGQSGRWLSYNVTFTIGSRNPNVMTLDPKSSCMHSVLCNPSVCQKFQGCLRQGISATDYNLFKCCNLISKCCSSDHLHVQGLFIESLYKHLQYNVWTLYKINIINKDSNIEQTNCQLECAIAGFVINDSGKLRLMFYQGAGRGRGGLRQYPDQQRGRVVRCDQLNIWVSPQFNWGSKIRSECKVQKRMTLNRDKSDNG